MFIAFTEKIFLLTRRHDLTQDQEVNNCAFCALKKEKGEVGPKKVLGKNQSLLTMRSILTDKKCGTYFAHSNPTLIKNSLQII
jgi:hypothetical protein